MDKIYKLPIDIIKNKIWESTKSPILLCGNAGSGKTEILESLKQDYLPNEMILDCTLEYGEYPKIIDRDAFKLFHISLLVLKMIGTLEENERIINMDILYLKKDLLHYVNAIYYLLSFADFSELVDYVGEEVLFDPESILNDFLHELYKNYSLKDINVIIDNFDKVGGSSSRYQELIYNVLKDKVNLILAVSDQEILNSSERRRSLFKNNSVVLADYNESIYNVKEILKGYIRKYNRYQAIERILNDDLVEKMINITNGNLTILINSLDYLNSIITEHNIGKIDLIYLDYLSRKVSVENEMFVIRESKLKI